MNIEEILSNTNYAKDAFGSILYQGDLVAPTQVVSNSVYENGKLIFDFSTYFIRSSLYSRSGHITKRISKNSRKQINLKTILEYFSIIEYFNIEGIAIPFQHCYSDMSYKFHKYFDTEYNQHGKINESLENILFRFKRTYSEEYESQLYPFVPKSHLIKSSKYIMFSMKDLKCYRFLRKAKKSALEHLTWKKYNNDEFPKLYVTYNDPTVNTIDLASLDKNRLTNNADIYKYTKDLRIFCAHPTKPHIDIIYKGS